MDNLTSSRQGVGVFEKSSMPLFGFTSQFSQKPCLNFLQTAGGSMITKHFAPKVIDGKVFIVWRKKPELGEGSPYKRVHQYQSYLKASLKAYMGNCKLASAEAEFARGAR